MSSIYIPRLVESALRANLNTQKFSVNEYGVYSVMVSTRVCGTLSSGSNPDRHPKGSKLVYRRVYYRHMKNVSQKGNARIVLLVIISLLIIGSVFYFYINKDSQNTSGTTSNFQSSSSSAKTFLETMKKDLEISSQVSIASYRDINGFGLSIPLQLSHAQYLQARLDSAGGQYATESDSGYTDGKIICINHGIREPRPDSPPATIGYEVVCADIN